jgi:hypothetical protein
MDDLQTNENTNKQQRQPENNLKSMKPSSAINMSVQWRKPTQEGNRQG